MLTHIQCKLTYIYPAIAVCAQKTPGSGTKDTHTHLQYTIFKHQLGLRLMNCRVLQLVVCSCQGSGCGFVVVAVLSPCLLFFFSVLSVCYEWTGRFLSTAWTRPAELSSPFAPKQDTTCLDTRGANKVQLCLLNYFCITKRIFAFFGFAVCSSCQNRSLFLCIVVSSINVRNRRQDPTKNALNLLLRQFSREAEGDSWVSFAPLSG